MIRVITSSPKATGRYSPRAGRRRAGSQIHELAPCGGADVDREAEVARGAIAGGDVDQALALALAGPQERGGDLPLPGAEVFGQVRQAPSGRG